MLFRKPFSFNFNLTCTDPSVGKLADKFLTKIGVAKNKYQQKRDLMICILSNFKLGRYNLPHDTSTLTIPLWKDFYSENAKRYKRNIVSYRNTNEIIKGLIKHGYLERFRGHVGKDYRSSYWYYPTQSLVTHLRKITYKEIDVQRPVSLLVLHVKIDKKTGNVIDRITGKIIDKKTGLVIGKRAVKKDDQKTVEIDFKDTRKTKKMTKELATYTDLRETIPIGLIDVPKDTFDKHKDYISRNIVQDINTLKPKNGKYTATFRKSYHVRVFNYTFLLGGRFYRGVESLMPSELRPYISINGKKTVEWDYSAYHIRMLYHIKKINYRGYPYHVDGKNATGKTKIYKLIGFISFNSKSIHKATWTLKDELIERDLIKYLPDNKYPTCNNLIDRFIKHNSRIKNKLFTGMGIKLQYRDSIIANNILKEYTAKKILVLCVHDSFIIEDQYDKQLKRAMSKYYYNEMKFRPVITKK